MSTDKYLYEKVDEWILRYDKLLILVFCLFVFIFKLGSGSLASWDEAFYAIASRDILHTGDWLTLYQADNIIFSKPPLYMWISAVFIRLFGENEFSIRLFSAFCGVGCVYSVYYFSKKLFGRTCAYISALTLVSASHFIIFARRGMLDVPLTFFFCLAFIFFWLGRDKNYLFLISGIFFGLAVMTKGAGGLLIPVIIGGYLLFSGELLKALINPFFWGSWLVAIFVFMPWHIYEFVKYGRQFLDEYLFYHVVKRATHSIEGHSGRYIYYVKKIIQKYRPWSVLSPFALFSGIAAWIKGKKEYIFIIIWILGVLVFYTIVPTKLQWYVIPMYPALAILIGQWISQVLKQRYLWGFTFIIIIVIALHIPYSHIFDMDNSKGLKDLVVTIDQKADYPIYSYRNSEWPVILFYAKRYPVDINETDELMAVLSSPKPFVCVLEKEKYEQMKSDLDKFDLNKKQSRNYVLLRRVGNR